MTHCLQHTHHPSFLSCHHKRRELEQGLERYEAAKRTRCVKEKTDAVDNHD